MRGHFFRQARVWAYEGMSMVKSLGRYWAWAWRARELPAVIFSPRTKWPVVPGAFLPVGRTLSGASYTSRLLLFASLLNV